MKTKIKLYTSLLICAMLPVIGMAQVDPGGNPDGNPPAAVPFDDNLNIILIAVGVILGAIVLAKMYRKPVSA